MCRSAELNSERILAFHARREDFRARIRKEKFNGNEALFAKLLSFL
jgi:hypothetical protein